jgi:hypothetical protein
VFLYRVWAAMGGLAAVTVSSGAYAQEIEPRSYSNAPVGVNFLITGYAYARGGLSFDPSLPVINAHLTTSTALVAYARSIDVFGKSGKFDVIVPYTWLTGSAEYAGEPVGRDVAPGHRQFAGGQVDAVHLRARKRMCKQHGEASGPRAHVEGAAHRPRQEWRNPVGQEFGHE